MKATQRQKTKYPGVFYRVGKRLGSNIEERIFYIIFKQDGKVIEEKVGRQFADDMTPAKAAGIRAERMEGKRLSRKEIRESLLKKDIEAKGKNTIESIWGLYFELNAHKISFNTYKSIYNLYLSKQFSKLQPSEIITSDIDKLRSQLEKENKAPQTVKHVLALLRRIIRFGVKKGLCTIPDQSKLHFEMPRIDNQKTESLSAEQLYAYLKALDEEPDQDAAAFLRIALATGMRRGALMALQWSDIDFDRNFIVLRGDSAKNSKTEKIPMSAMAKKILQNIAIKESIYVFPGKSGQQRKEFRRIAQRVKEKAGLPKDFRPLHGLRHAYASFLASSGKVDLYTIQKLLTHSSPQMTQRYAHLADEALQKAASVIDESLEQFNNKIV